MAINYEQVGWDTNKYVNPTRMNHMDDGIKAACDKADAHDQQIETINSNLNNKDTYTLNSGLIESTLHVRGNIGIVEFNTTFKVGLGASEWVGMALLPDGIRATPYFVAQIESVSGTQISIQFLPNGAIQMYSRGGIVEGYLVGNIVFPLA